MNRLIFFVSLLVVAGSASAQQVVPEIDASGAAVALGLVTAVVTLLHERRKRK